MNFRWVVGLLAVGFPAIANTAEVRPDTLAVWNQYLQRIESRTQSSLGGNGQFLWIDRDPEHVERVHQGEILVASGAGANGLEAVPHGLIHDWIGAAFIPGVTLPEVFAVVDDYTRYNEFYRPAVIDAALLCRSEEGSGGEKERFRVRYSQKVLFTSEILDSEYEVRHFRPDERRWYSIAQSTRIQESRDHGKPGESVEAADEGSRYVWRIYCLARYEQRDGGVYVEHENIVLSRGIPISLRWLVEPAIRQLSKDLTMASLHKTREAVRLVVQGPAPSTSLPVKSGG